MIPLTALCSVMMLFLANRASVALLILFGNARSARSARHAHPSLRDKILVVGNAIQPCPA